MKKIIIVLLLFIVTGCEVNFNNTPKAQAEIFLGRYQTLHKDVLNDLDTELNKTTLSDENKEKYRSIMKKHYQDLEYNIKDEKIDGNKATVEVSIKVNDYTDINSKLVKLISELNIKDENEIDSRRLDLMKNSKKQIEYTILLTFKNENNKWIIEPLTRENMDKINGIYTE